jgi:hypothetical protein
MKLNTKSRTLAVLTVGILVLLSACGGPPAETPATPLAVDITESVPTAAELPATAPEVDTAVPEPAGNAPGEVIVYASDLPSGALSELDFIDDSASPGGKLIGLPNNGDELDPPPENDPHLTFDVPIQSGIPYRCWVHMKVGTPKGRSTANVVWVQFSDSVDQAGQEVLRPSTNSYLTAQGPSQEGWTWVGCDQPGTDSLVYFQSSGQVTVRLQAGAEGVGIDQFILSPAKFLNGPPTEPIVVK